MITMASRARLRAIVLDQLLIQARPFGVDVELVLGLDADDATITYADATKIQASGVACQAVRGTWPTVAQKQNATIETTRGRWVTLWDDDDWSGPDRLAKTFEAIATTGGDLIGVERIHYHELTSPDRRTVEFTTPAVIVDGLATFRRKLWEAAPFEVKSCYGDVGDWIVQRTRAGATVRTTVFDYVAMIHGTNATRAQPFRVDAINGKVFDGPREFKLVGGRATAAAIMGDAMLTQYEAAVA
jgi:hypothetical protein